MPAGVLFDQYGVPNSPFSGTYIVDITSAPYPTPLTGQAPGGQPDLRPFGHRRDRLRRATPTPTPCRWPPTRTLSLVLTVDPSLIGQVTLLDPGGNTIATATGAVGRPDGRAPDRAGRDGWHLLARRQRLRRHDRQLHAPGHPQRRLQAGHRHQQLDRLGLRPVATPSPAWARPPTPTAPACWARSTPRGNTDYYKFFLNAGQSATLADAGTERAGLAGSLRRQRQPPGPAGRWPQSKGPSTWGAASRRGSILTLNGSARISGSNLELTDGGFSEAGSAFNTNQVYVGNFSTSFNFQITPGHCPHGRRLDLHDPGERARTPSGSAEATSVTGESTPSVAIKFDLYDNAGEGTDSTGIYTNGAGPLRPRDRPHGHGHRPAQRRRVQRRHELRRLDAERHHHRHHHPRVGQPVVQREHPVDHRRQRGLRRLHRRHRRADRGPEHPELDLHAGSDRQSPRKFESINNFVAPASGWYYAEVERRSRDQLQPGRHPRRRLRPPRQQLRNGPAARRHQRGPGCDRQGLRALSRRSTSRPSPSPTSTRPTPSPAPSATTSSARTTTASTCSARTWPSTAPTPTTTTATAARAPSTSSTPPVQSSPRAPGPTATCYSGLAYLERQALRRLPRSIAISTSTTPAP